MVQHSRGDESQDFTSGPLTDEFYQMLRQGRSFSGKERNCVFLNTLGDPRGGGRFATISAVSGLDFPDDGRAVAHVDWDDDGDLDLWISNRTAPRLRLMRNDGTAGNHFVQFRLEGNGSDTNRDAIGAQVKVVLDPLADRPEAPGELIQSVHAGDGFLSQGTTLMHFGLGKDRTIRQVLVRWPNPDADWEEFPAVERDRRYRLRQGSGVAEPLLAQRAESALQRSELESPPATEQHRIPLIFQLPAPPITLTRMNGESAGIPYAGSGDAVLLNIWSSTCRPCLAELQEFVARYDELREQGVRIVAINIDELTGEYDPDSGEARKAAADTVQRLQMPFDTGMADPELIDRLQQLHNSLIKLEKPLPLPTSFLIDRDGNLDVIYKGAVDVDTLLADARAADDNSVQARFLRSAPFPGTLVDAEPVMKPLAIEGAAVHLRLAREFTSAGQYDRAMAELEKAMRISPDSAVIRNDYAVLLKLRGETDRAIEHFREAVRLNPARAGFRVNLAQMLIARNELDEATDQLQAVVAEEPGHSDAHFYLGTIQARRRNPEQARAFFEQAIQRNPEHARARFSLGHYYLQIRDPHRASEEFRSALETAPREPAILLSLSRSLLQLDRAREAVQPCQRAVEIQPGNPDAHYTMGLVWSAAGDPGRARESWQTALELAPNHPGALQALQSGNPGR